MSGDRAQNLETIRALLTRARNELLRVPGAAIPAILVRPDNETFRVNALSAYNVIDAAVKLGIGKVIFASSETTYGICFADGEGRDNPDRRPESRHLYRHELREPRPECYPRIM